MSQAVSLMSVLSSAVLCNGMHTRLFICVPTCKEISFNFRRNAEAVHVLWILLHMLHAFARSDLSVKVSGKSEEESW